MFISITDERSLRRLRSQQSKCNDTSKIDALVQLKKTALNKGFEIVDNDGKGNCMFLALADQLRLMQRKEYSHRELRKLIVKNLRENPKSVSFILSPLHS